MSESRVVVQMSGEDGTHFVSAEQLGDAYVMDDGPFRSDQNNASDAVILSSTAQAEDDIDVTGGEPAPEVHSSNEPVRIMQQPIDVHHRAGPTYIVRSVPAHKAMAMGMKMAQPPREIQQPDHAYTPVVQEDHHYGVGHSGEQSHPPADVYTKTATGYIKAEANDDAEKFPIMGDLEAYLDDPQAGVDSIPTQAPHARYAYEGPRVVREEGINITSYRQGGAVRYRGNAPLIYRGKTEMSYQPEFKVHGNTKYFRPHHGGQLIRIGNRTFIAMEEQEEPAYYPLGPTGRPIHRPVPFATRTQLPPTAVPALRGGRQNTSRMKRVQPQGSSSSPMIHTGTTLREVPNMPRDMQQSQRFQSSVAPMVTAQRTSAPRRIGLRTQQHVVTNHQQQRDDDEMQRALEREEQAMKGGRNDESHFLEDVEKKYSELLSRPLAGGSHGNITKSQYSTTPTIKPPIPQNTADIPLEQYRVDLHNEPPHFNNSLNMSGMNTTDEYTYDTYDDAIQTVIDRAMSGVLGAEIDAALHAAHAAASELMRQRAMERARDANIFRSPSARGRQAPIAAEYYQRSRVDSIFDGIYDSSKFERRFADRLKMDDESNLAARALESEMDYDYNTGPPPADHYSGGFGSPGNSGLTSYGRSIVHVPSNIVQPQYHHTPPSPPKQQQHQHQFASPALAPSSMSCLKLPQPPSECRTSGVVCLAVDHVLSDLDLSSEDSDSTDSDRDSSESDVAAGSSEGEWAGVDYITRCICGLQHNDEFMIECDQCGVWQHCRCMSIDTKKVPENYLCERCKPRKLKQTPVQAREMQQKKLNKWNREKERRRQTKMKKREHKVKIRMKKREEKVKKRRIIEELPVGKVKMSDKYQFLMHNEYTDDAKRFLQSQSDTRGANLLEVPSENICQVMFVAESVQGLVSTMTVPPNQPVAEYRGKVCTKAECNGRDKLGRVLPYTLLYSGFTPTESMLASRYVPDGTLVVDARLKGSPARFARRSCRPNTQVKHVIKSGMVHMLLISTELIEEGTEVTIPFDFDYRTARQPLDCACVAPQPAGEFGDPQAERNEFDHEPHICPISEFNEQLKEHTILARQARMNESEVVLKERERVEERAALKAAAKARSMLRKKLERKVSKEVERQRRTEKMMKQGPSIQTRKPAPANIPPPKKQAEASARALKKAKQHANKAASNKNKKQQLKVKLASKSMKSSRRAPPRTHFPVKSRRVASKSPSKRSSGSLSPRKKQIDSETRRRSRAESVGSEMSVDLNTKRENQMLKELRDYWNKDAAQEDEEMVPEEIPTRTSREERKIQMMLQQFKKLEESERKKDDKRLSDEPAATRGRSGPKTKVVEKKKGKRRSGSKWKRGIDKKKIVHKKTSIKIEKSPRRASRHRVFEEPEEEDEDESSDEGEESDNESDKEMSDREIDHKPQSPQHNSPRVDTPASPMQSAPYSTRSSAGSPLLHETTVKKRWLKQAIQEQQQSKSPPKKRTRHEETSSPIAMSNVEAAELLAGMHSEASDAMTSRTTRSSAAVVVESLHDVHSTHIQPHTFETDPQMPDDLLQPSTGDWEEPQPPKEEPATRTRRKVTLDEYKKRKPGIDGEANTVKSGQSGFIPKMTDQINADPGRSIRLANLPDPSEIGRSSETLDDLKARIYGKRYAAEQRTTRSSVIQVEDTPPPPPPGPPPTRRSARDMPPAPDSPEKGSHRLSLAERLRTEFGLQEDDGTSAPSTSAAPQPSQAINYPPSVPYSAAPGALDPNSFQAMYHHSKVDVEEHSDSSDSIAVDEEQHESTPVPELRRSGRYNPESPRAERRGQRRGAMRGRGSGHRGAPRH